MQQITVAEAAQRLGVKPRWVRVLIADGRLSATYLTPRMLLVNAADVDKLAKIERSRGRPRKETT